MTILSALWWLFSNGITYCLMLRFLLAVTRIEKSIHFPLWLAVNSSITLLVLRYQIPGAFFLAALFALLFAKLACRRSWAVLLPPLAVLFTLYSVLEGFSALAMSWAARTLPSQGIGALFQCALSLLMNTAFFFALRASQRFLAAERPVPLAPLSLLLLPCAWMLLSLRWALRLDNRQFEAHLGAMEGERLLFLSLVLAGGTVVLFVLLQAFCRVRVLTGQAGAAVLLRQQLRGQQLCLEETQAQADRYASFQHDIDNHLLVLSGLLQEENYPEAQRYVHRLHQRSPTPLTFPSTGSAALDALLREKLAQAEDAGIQVHYNVSLPPDFPLDDTDLCALFANLLDNAMHACEALDSEHRWLSLHSKVRGTLLFLEAVNPTLPHQTAQPGTGLKNVQRIAEHYQGNVQIQQEEERFYIRVLLTFPAK